MKKLILALMLVAMPAMAAGTDGGVQEQKCAGFTVSADQARDFSMYYGVLIISSSQSTPTQNLVPEDKQLKVVSVLKQLDAAVTSKSNSFCVNSKAEDVDLTLAVADDLSKEIQRAHNEKTLGQLLMMVNKDSRDRVLTMMAHVSEVASKMFVYAGKGSTL